VAGDPESAQAFEYFHRIETDFILHRGAPLLLSAADYQLARSWYEQGVPLWLVLRAIEEVFARREHKPRKAMLSLRYCRRAVEAAWTALRELQAPGERTAARPLDLAARLSALAAALPAEVPDRDGWSARIAALGGEAEGVEAALADLDQAILDAAAERLSDEDRESLADRAEAALGELAERLPAAEAEASRRRLERRLLRRELGLPVLSLFSPEAEAADGG
jgi:hypothetical protein